MGQKSKWFADKDGAASKMYEDVGANNFFTYDVPDYLDHFSLPVHTKQLAEKWAGVTVAASGDPVTGRDWLVVVPYRLDYGKEAATKVHDLDPVVMVLDTNTGTPHPSGVVAYHQKFTGRTSLVDGLNSEPLDVAVQAVRQELFTGLAPLEAAPAEVVSALHHMHQKFGPAFWERL